MKKKIPLFYKIILGMVIGITLGHFSYLYHWDFIFRLAHTFNLFFTDLLKWIIPFLIISYMVPTITKLSSSSSKLLIYVVLYTVVSCYFAAFFAFFLGKASLPLLLSNISGQNLQIHTIEPFFRVPLIPLLSVTQALVFSIFLILFGHFKQNSPIIALLLDFQSWVKIVMSNCILPLMPFYILTIFVKIASNGSLSSTLLAFLPIIGVVAITDMILILFWSILYGITAKTSLIKLFKNYKTPVFFGFVSQSSSATLPITLDTCYKNSVSNDIVEFAIPLSTSINATGGSTAVILSALALSFMGGLDTSWHTFFPFILNVPPVIFSSVGIPGGASFVISPLLEHILHFAPSMIGLTQTIIILQDSFSTATNVATCILVTLFIEKRVSHKKELIV